MDIDLWSNLVCSIDNNDKYAGICIFHFNVDFWINAGMVDYKGLCKIDWKFVLCPGISILFHIVSDFADLVKEYSTEELVRGISQYCLHLLWCWCSGGN